MLVLYFIRHYIYYQLFKKLQNHNIVYLIYIFYATIHKILVFILLCLLLVECLVN